MKLNKLKLEDSLQNSAQPSTTGSKLFSKLKASENPEPSEETTAQNVSGTGIFSKLRTTETNTVENTNQERNIDGNKLYSNLRTTEQNTRPNAFSLKFTEGEAYNLDDIIFTKRRDNAKCPLIVYVNQDNDNDERVLMEIMKLALNDYSVEYDPNTTDVDSPLYYKNAISKIPNFYNIFDIYIGRYYSIYHDKYQALTLGSISLSSIIETIQSTHDDVYANLLNNDTYVQTYNSDDEYNKPQIDIEYGSLPDEEYDPGESGGDLFEADDFSFVETDDGIVLKYKESEITNATIPFTFVEEDIDFSEDISDNDLISSDEEFVDFIDDNEI